MQTKIKELAYQANLLDDDGWNTTNLTNSTEKFAELIINECAMLTLDYKNDDHYNGWLDFRNAIRKHFGVEE